MPDASPAQTDRQRALSPAFAEQTMALPFAEVPTEPGFEQNAPGVTVPPGRAAEALRPVVGALDVDAVVLDVRVVPAAARTPAAGRGTACAAAVGSAPGVGVAVALRVGVGVGVGVLLVDEATPAAGADTGSGGGAGLPQPAARQASMAKHGIVRRTFMLPETHDRFGSLASSAAR